MRPDAPSPRLVTLLSRLSDESLTPEENQELEAMLLRDPDARQYYRWHAAVHVALTERGGHAKFEPRNIVRPRFGRRLLAMAALLALCATPAWFWWQHRDRTPDDAVVQQVIENRPVAAVVSAATGVHWSEESPAKSGTVLHPGELTLGQGSLWLSLPKGQTVFVQGPARVELVSADEFSVLAGKVAFRSEGIGEPFIVRLPKGALVDRGSEFSVNAGPGGHADVLVFRENLAVCTVAASGRTREERVLNPGQGIGLDGDFAPVTSALADFLRVPPPPRATGSSGSGAYPAAVKASAPAAYWRFEDEGSGRTVPDEMGGSPLLLVENAALAGDSSHRYLSVDDTATSGFAIPRDRAFALKPAGGFSVECLVYSTSEDYGTVLAMEQVGGPDPGFKAPSHVHHAAQYFALERMGRRGEHINHVHPDFALRSLFRAPAGFDGGINIFSKESHLVHRWVHAVATVDGERIRLYVDGKLSDDVPATLNFSGTAMRPIIGRLQPYPGDERRQWIGGIDEVALYPRALSAEEVAAHYETLQQ